MKQTSSSTLCGITEELTQVPPLRSQAIGQQEKCRRQKVPMPKVSAAKRPRIESINAIRQRRVTRQPHEGFGPEIPLSRCGPYDSSNR